MIKEYIKTLDNLRPEETRFNFDPLNRNLCFCTPLDASSSGGTTYGSNNPTGAGGSGSGGSGGGTTESGGLSEEDKAMKQMFYDEIKELFDQEYKPYTEDRYTNRSQDELDVLKELKAGGGYQDLYDQASRDLGFSSKGIPL